MQFSVLQEPFKNALKTALKAIDRRPSLAILANVQLETKGSRLHITGSQLTETITTDIGAKIAIGGEGRITLPAKTLFDLVSKLPPERVDMTLDETTSTMQIRCGKTKATIKGIAATEYPAVKHLLDFNITMNAATFKEMVQQTAFCAATKDNRPVLTGIYVKVGIDSGIEMAAADGYRLSVCSGDAQTELSEQSVIIPARALKDVASFISDEEADIRIAFPDDESPVTFQIPQVTVSLQELEGRFPDYQSIVPASWTTNVTCYSDDLQKACKRAYIFARDNANDSGTLMIKAPTGPSEPGEVHVTGRSDERGDLNTMIDASVHGPDIEAIFSIPYLSEALRAMPTERVIIESNGAAHPAVLKPEGRDDFVHVIMPMST